ncbi:hypothetical protein [Haloechinothrix salitolerans]|uniref:Uncharacterized protein n=1 Tax=Haloechinothrix salitolerans TaxID=926830 RepID=A0ABW2BUC3_9PSEU
MTEHPAQTLADIQELRERSRRLAHGGVWLPALLLASLVVASTLLYQFPFHQPMSEMWRFPFWPGLPAQPRSHVGAYLFWFIGLPLTVLATGAWYRWRGRRMGVKVAWPWFALTTLATLALLAIIAAVPTRTVTAQYPDGWRGLLTPLLAVAVAAIALGVIERSRGLIFGGVWLGLIASWHCALGMGGLPGWVTWLLSGGEGPALGGQLTLLGLHRPGPVLMLAALPLLIVGLMGLRRTRGGTE